MSKKVKEGKHEDPFTKENCWKYGHTAKEIAVIMGCSENAVWILLSRAMRKMKAGAIK